MSKKKWTGLTTLVTATLKDKQSMLIYTLNQYCVSRSAMSDSLQPHGL